MRTGAHTDTCVRVGRGKQKQAYRQHNPVHDGEHIAIVGLPTSRKRLDPQKGVMRRAGKELLRDSLDAPLDLTQRKATSIGGQKCVDSFRRDPEFFGAERQRDVLFDQCLYASIPWRRRPPPRDPCGVVTREHCLDGAPVMSRLPGSLGDAPGVCVDGADMLRLLDVDHGEATSCGPVDNSVDNSKDIDRNILEIA